MADDRDRDQRWYVVKHQPARCALALEHLARQDIKAYSPRGKFERISNGKLIRETKQVFQGYLFVSLILDNARWRAINGTRGVIHMLASAPGNRPTPVPVGEVEYFIDRERRGKLILSEISRIRKGDQVRFKNGPLANIVCQCEWTRGERVFLLLNLVGATNRISAPAHTLSLVHQAGVR